MSNTIQDLKKKIANGLQMKTLTSCSRWAEKCRVMGGDFAGPYSFLYHPWAKEPHDSMASWNVAMKGAQTGLTEVCINRSFYVLDIIKRDVLYVFPTDKAASDFSKGRFDPALRLSPHIREMFTSTNTVGLKQAGSTNLYIRGSRSDSNLVSIPVSELILDEVDRMDQKQVHMALARLDGHLRKCVWCISTPTAPDFGIHKLYKDTTQEHFMFKCPRCSKQTELVWPDCVEIVGEAVSDPRCRESFLKCKECGGKLEQETKPEWLSTGKWVVTNENSDRDRRGFHINQLYSFTVNAGEIAQAYFRGMGDESANTEFYNNKLGLPYVGDGAQVTDGKIDECISHHLMADPRPKRGSDRLITMGIDQGKWNYVEIDEWFIDELGPDLNASATCKVLWAGKFFEEDAWTQFDRLMYEFQVQHCLIDADPNPLLARRFARRFPGYVTLTRFRKGVSHKEINISKDDNNADVAIVDRVNWLDSSLGRFHSGRIILPRDIPLEYRDHIRAPVRIYTRDEFGNPIAKYINSSPDHYALTRCYAEVALPFAASYTQNRDIKNFL